MAVYGVIDIGTNSIKLHVADVEAGATRVLDDRARVTRLGAGMHVTGELGEEAQRGSVEAIRSFLDRGRELGAVDWAAVGTMALRAAANAPRFVERVRAETGLEIEVIPGEEEARLANLAALLGVGELPGGVCIFDTGGGSTEFVLSVEGDVRDSFSLNVGSRRPTEEHCVSDPVAQEELDALLAALRRELAPVRERARAVDHVVGIGGTVTTLAAISLELADYRPEAVQGMRLPRREIRRIVDLLRRLTLAERRGVVGLNPARADVMLAGAALSLTVMEHLGLDDLIVSDRGLRHAVMADRFANR